MVYGHKQINRHTHVCNAVPLVWGSLRLAPIILLFSIFQCNTALHMNRVGCIYKIHNVKLKMDGKFAKLIICIMVMHIVIF